ncbi:MAG: CoA transferase subunit A [Dehalococcoidales bacterium]|nr:MAG: CoA transferase subunit A [Dehalococcoidales bacterium]
MSKICTADKAMARVHDSDMIAAHNWGISGSPGYLFRALVERGVKDLTLCIPNFIPMPEGFVERGLTDPSILLPQVRKIISPFIGARGILSNLSETFLSNLAKEGRLEIETSTHGILMERLYAGATGLGGIYSPVGVDTIVAEGKEKRNIDEVDYVFEKPLRPDVGLIKADKADTLGNLVYRGSARGANPLIAMASKYTIVEVFDVVEPGVLEPEMIVTPGVFVDCVVRIPDEDIYSGKRRTELIQLLAEVMLARGM